MGLIWLLQAVVFLAAFLLFQIELIAAKILLPLYGGSFQVWGGCVVFFQAVLLFGYIAAHNGISRLGLERYRWVHLVFLFIPLFGFPGRPLSVEPHPVHGLLAIDIFFQLARTIGPVFFVLSTFSLVLQEWLAASNLEGKNNPYSLYAISNLGSFAALLSYPFVVENLFELDTQLHIWRAGYFLLVVLQLWLVLLVRPVARKTQGRAKTATPPIEKTGRWFLFGAGTSILFLAVTNILTSEVAPIPLLWILPLSIYLISFVLVFKRNPWCPPWIETKFPMSLGFAAVLYFLTFKGIIPYPFVLLLYGFFLFHICMRCQSELMNDRPKDREGLTLFYVLISTGSFFGGILVSWIIPLVSVSFVEYFIGLFVVSLAVIIGRPRDKISPYDVRLLIYLIVLLMIWPMVFNNYNIFGMFLLILPLKFLFSELGKKRYVLHLSMACILFASPLLDSFWPHWFYIYRHRNFYGLYRIYDDYKETRYLLHGTTLHGAQYLDEKKSDQPLTYYHKKTPVGELMESKDFSLKKMGVVGLGVGTMSAYGRSDLAIDFFEIDPDVYQLAKQYFTYLQISKSPIQFIYGDARISMTKKAGAGYDLLIIDAFSSDAIPVHLLTTEAMEVYRKALKPDGIILFHTSNRYLALDPILKRNAKEVGAKSAFKTNNSGPGQLYASDWVLVTWDAAVWEKLVKNHKWNPYSSYIEASLRPWTDQYSNMTSRLRMRDLITTIKTFQPLNF